MKQKLQEGWQGIVKWILTTLINIKKPWQFIGIIFLICFLSLLAAFCFNKSFQSLILQREQIEVKTAQPESEN